MTRIITLLIAFLEKFGLNQNKPGRRPYKPIKIKGNTPFLCDKYNKKFRNYENDLKLRGFSKETIKSYIYHNYCFLQFVKKEPKYVTKADIKKYLLYLNDNLMNKPRTINLQISALKNFYDDYHCKKLFHDIKRLKTEKRIPIVFSKEEIERMINNTQNIKHKLLISLLYSSGLRVSECIKLKLKDIDFNNNLIRINLGKGKKDRIVMLSIRVKQMIKDYIKEYNIDNYLFPGINTSHITKETAELVVRKKGMKVIKKRVFPHALRASFATHLNNNKVDISKIQKLMGHADQRTTEVYIKTNPKDIQNIKSPLDS